MPAIRDWTYNYTTSTTGTTITCAVPDYQQNDLLLAILSTDTGTQTWTSSGWTQLFSLTNTSNLAVMYKIASASEPAEYTFTYNVAETANAAILSIMDVDTTTPIDGYANANNTAARLAMPTRTASRNNSLNIYAWNHGSTAVIPSAIEGPVTQIISKDGSAHVDGFAWNFQPTAGTTPNNIYWTVSGTTYNGLRVVITINPPLTGATVIPTYCAADNSIYVDPIHGTTAFRGNTAFAATATTYWTSPLAGRTLANATVSAVTDFGINTYRSAGGMTGPTTANTYTGATLVLAAGNIVDVTGKNVLVHAMPALPADLQTVYDTGLGKGVEVGMASSANNGKVWHVHGFNSPWGINRVPVVINSANTSGVIDSRGTFNPASVQIFGFFTCGYLVSSDWRWTMIWVLDTTVVAGGNSSNPVNITDIVRVVSDGHERMSAVLQGKNQMLLLQPIQFGNGGTNPIYLDLDSTAIEFPEIYNPSKKQTYYCSVDNVAGITYYAGANDTIKHRNSVVSSSSKYHWRFHSSSSTSAAYDFSGLTVIGAGDIQLVAGLPLSGITWSKCDGFNSAGAYLDNCVIRNSNSTAALTVDSPTYMSRITNCSFENNTRAIKITTAGTYTFDNLTFSGNTYDIENASNGAVIINCINGSNPSTYINTNGGTTTINNAVSLQVKCVDKNNNPLQGIRVYIEKSSDKTQILNSTTDIQGIVSTTYNYTSDTLININIRRSSVGSTRYLPYNTTGTITSTGFNLTVVLYEDNIASPV